MGSREARTRRGKVTLLRRCVVDKKLERNVRNAIRIAEKLLPGKPPADSKATDQRWQAIIRVGDFIEDAPELVWQFALRWSKTPQADLRDAVATVLLEHLLEHHFKSMFPRVREEAAKSRRFVDTLSRCWWMGEAGERSNARALDRLVGKKKRPRFPD